MIKYLAVFTLFALGASADSSSSCSGLVYKCEIEGTSVGDCLDCPDFPNADEDNRVCIKRRLFQDSRFIGYEIAATIIWFFAAGLAMSAGVGGGGIYVPLGILLVRFASKPATGLSQASIFGASFAGLIINSRNRHPLADRPIIDFDMALFLAPMEMAGAVLGVLIQKTLPDWAIVLLMASILGATAVKTYTKGLESFKKEKAKKAAAKAAAEAESGPSKSVENLEMNAGAENVNTTEMNAGTENTAGNENAAGTENNTTENTTTAENTGTENNTTAGSNSVSPVELAGDAINITLEEGAHTAITAEKAKTETKTCEEWLAQDAARPTKKYGALAILWCFLVFIQIVKGGKGMKSMFPDAIPYCGFGYWSLTALSFLWMFGFGAFFGRKAVKDAEAKRAVGYPFVKDSSGEDPQWDVQKCLFYARWTFVAGIIAGLIGIGGGMVLGPLMLQMRILPQVSTATTATMIVLTSSNVAILYVINGLVPVEYAVFFFCVAFCGAFVGKSQIDAFVKRNDMTSLLIFILATIIAAATIMVTIAGIIQYSKVNWCMDGFKPMCG